MGFITKWVHLVGTYIVQINAQERREKKTVTNRKEEKIQTQNI